MSKIKDEKLKVLIEDYVGLFIKVRNLKRLINWLEEGIKDFEKEIANEL